jgi:hypothetical protein
VELLEAGATDIPARLLGLPLEVEVIGEALFRIIPMAARVLAGKSMRVWEWVVRAVLFAILYSRIVWKPAENGRRIPVVQGARRRVPLQLPSDFPVPRPVDPGRVPGEIDRL